MQNQKNAEQWEKIKEIFGAELECTPDRRRAFLEDTCGGNEAMRAEVESLLSAYEKPSGLSEPPWTGASADVPK
jgi:hypothetical protein